MVEFIDAVQPPYPREKKWVLIVSTLYGCPAGCPMCDAGGFYRGKISTENILEQIDFLVRRRYPDGNIPAEKFKVQFARMGEPSFNMNVIEVLDELHRRYHAPGLMPCLSTVAPSGTDDFFNRLVDVKEEYYKGRFQLQFSIHSTDDRIRDYLIPLNKWSLEKIARYGRRYFRPGDRKVTLNFAPANNIPIEADILKKYFDPEIFFIKITPLNPTYRSRENRLVSYIDPHASRDNYSLIGSLRDAGYEVILSIGEVIENDIGSNCGQYVMHHLRMKTPLEHGYSYTVDQYCPE
jgi:23S rRNA (adenine2503-C2)-methyltransferase